MWWHTWYKPVLCWKHLGATACWWGCTLPAMMNTPPHNAQNTCLSASRELPRCSSDCWKRPCTRRWPLWCLTLHWWSCHSLCSLSLLFKFNVHILTTRYITWSHVVLYKRTLYKHTWTVIIPPYGQVGNYCCWLYTSYTCQLKQWASFVFSECILSLDSFIIISDVIGLIYQRPRLPGMSNCVWSLLMALELDISVYFHICEIIKSEYWPCFFHSNDIHTIPVIHRNNCFSRCSFL